MLAGAAVGVAGGDAAEVVPDDPRYPEQWHYHEATGGINLPPAWDLSTGAGVTVAVVDSGSIDHVDLTANTVGGYDFVTAVGNSVGQSCDGDARDPDPTDSCGVTHGNHVAGTVAAVTDNGEGVAGVAFDARVVPVRILGGGNVGSLSDIVDGINWAVGGTVPGVPANPNPTSVVNLSIEGALPCPQSLQAAVTAAIEDHGATLVVAAGNLNSDATSVAPANCEGAFLRVAASDRDGARAPYSNFGPIVDVTAPGGASAAPGEGVLSTVDNDGYGYNFGTSMAAPHVAGVVALVRSTAPHLTPEQVVRLVKRTARPLPGPCPEGCGAGLLDAHAAVKAALRTLSTGSLAGSS